MRKRCFGLSLISGILVLNLFGSVKAEDKSLMDEMRIIKQGEGEVREKKDDEKVIERYYYKKEVIKEVPEEQGKYEKHLWEELKKKLKKPKKLAEIWRVEDDLIELNKGSIHKVREGDVYAIYDKNGKFKGKMEVGAIADAVSIGESLKKNHSIEKGNLAKYLGQRRFWCMGPLIGINVVSRDKIITDNENYKAYGIYWRLLYKKAWGIGISMFSTYLHEQVRFDQPYDIHDNMPSTWKKYSGYTQISATDRLSYRNVEFDAELVFIAPIDVRKYFFHPMWYTCYLGLGTSYFQSKYRMFSNKKYESLDNAGNWNWNWDKNEEMDIVNGTKNSIVPIATGGIELTLGQYLRFVISGYYLHGPKINIDGYELLTRPMLFSVAFVGSW